MKTTSLRAYAAVGLLAAAPAALAITGSIGESNWTGSEATSNPYDVSNMKCEWYDGEGGVFEGEVLYADGTNPYYPKGLCTAPTINLSARTPYTCEASGGSDGLCPGAADMTCVDDEAFGQLCSSLTDPEDNQLLDKLLTWYECPGWTGVIENGVLAPSDIPGGCYIEPDSALLGPNLDDRSWYMPIDISKAHRGFLDGDFVFLLYAWSPNFKLNAVGRDRYELYTRRSFDGGITWTTTPDSFVASNEVSYSGSGTTTCETWRDGADSTTDSHVCTAYGAGDAEQSRNVTQHKSMRITTLDPRYSPTTGSVGEPPLDYDGWTVFEPIDPTDLRDPSRNFVVFETGDNTTVAVGEAEPLNLDYGRGEVFGDHYTVWSEIDTGVSDPVADCYPSNTYGDTAVAFAEGTGFCNEFDSLEGFPLALSEEASVTASAYGDFLYGVWGQFNVDDTGELVDADVLFRRVWWLDEYIAPDAYDNVGGSEGQNP
ncbi:choice-of-anchor O protein [uncultured Thiohalocapsa sp.]|uniref:choice-of-anchor O protein n=1 Tax=uncultured Thiohalocapsa sp. TaxID=768990 RepID=UPI0025CC6A84|nr:choice-of-anchor O protein [uncultured Thiohalocapsa sp.]